MLFQAIIFHIYECHPKVHKVLFILIMFKSRRYGPWLLGGHSSKQAMVLLISKHELNNESSFLHGPTYEIVPISICIKLKSPSRELVTASFLLVILFEFPHRKGKPTEETEGEERQ